ncbi:MAG: 50S ribosomal protein L19 [Aquificota bacterium]|nr:MAG: 50S ribosomal protein L19 [Aquificota bacterium]
MSEELIRAIESRYLRDDLPEFKVGDTVRVYFRIREGDKERVQPFEGVVLRFQGAMNRRTFTVRRITGGLGVERTFPLHSPRLEKVEVIRRGKVRRAKLYYLRDRMGKAARVRERFYTQGNKK